MSVVKRLDKGQITGRLDETKLQQWLSMTHGNVEAKRSLFSYFNYGSSYVAAHIKYHTSSSRYSVFMVSLLFFSFNREISSMFQTSTSLVASFTKAE